MKAIQHGLAFFLLTLVYTFTTASTASITTTTQTAAVSFVKSTCNSTTFPDLCNKVCLPYAQKIKGDLGKMAAYSLKGIIFGSKKSSKTLLKLSKGKSLKASEKQAIQDCLEENDDSLDELKESASMAGNMKNASANEDVKTWLSAALTDEETCLDGLDEENVSSSIKAKISTQLKYVDMLCSNSLAIINLIKF